MLPSLMESGILLRILGVACILAGIVLVANPELVSHKPVPSDPFEAVERRIWWGLLIGLGILFLFLRTIHPWQPTLAATGSALLFGLLVARLMGIALDGSVAKQWLYVGIEVILLALFLWWYFHVR